MLEVYIEDYPTVTNCMLRRKDLEKLTFQLITNKMLKYFTTRWLGFKQQTSFHLVVGLV